MRFRILENGQVVSREAGAALQQSVTLAYDHSLYFTELPGIRQLPLKDLVVTRARPDGVASANLRMQAAASGQTKRRAPITVELSPEGHLLVRDGNSTFLNALLSGWPDIPYQLVARSPSPTPETQAVEADPDTAFDHEEAKSIVSHHLDRRGEHYLTLLEEVRVTVGKAVRRVGHGIVSEVYSRSKKQGPSNEFKDRSKIQTKLMEARAKNSSYNVQDMNDIVGYTVVVYYNDQIPKIIAAFEAEADKALLMIQADDDGNNFKVHRDKGYHATHLRIFSRSPALTGLRMEIQIKTMLHDAWGAKMHDLTYKPSGQFDPRMKTLMESFGDSLQAIEVQSETLRDAIETRVAFIHKKKRIARQSLLKNLKHRPDEIDQGSEKAKAAAAAFADCLEQITSNRKKLATCLTTDKLMLSVIEHIDRLPNLGVSTFDNLKLTTYLASLRDDTQLAPVVDKSIKALKESDANLLAFTVSSVLHQTNRLEEAINYLKPKIVGPVRQETSLLRLNLLNYLIENNLGRVPDERQKSEARRILAELKISQIFDAGNPYAGAFLSSEAAFYIVFGNDTIELDDENLAEDDTDEDSTELDTGITLANEAMRLVEPYGRPYCRLYLAYAWQRKVKA